MIRLAHISHTRLWMLLTVTILCAKLPVNAQIDSAFLNAVKKCDYSVLQQSIKSNIKVIEKGDNEINVFMWAADYSGLPLARFLVRHGAKFNDSAGIVPLFKAAATILSKQGEVKRGVSREIILRQIIMEQAKACFGEAHPVFARTVNSLANMYFRMGKYELALPLYQQAVNIRKKTLGAEHPEYLTSVNDLADLYMSMGQYEKALPLYESTLAIRKKVLGSEHPEYATSLNSLAYLYKEMGQYEKALPLYEQALVIRNKIFGEEHPNSANVLNNLAFLYREMAHYEKALSLHQQALSIRKKALGDEHPDYATSLNDLAYLYLNMGKYKLALPLYEKALAIRKKALGEEHPDYATTLNFLAILHREMGQPKKALPLLEQAVAIRKKILGEDHPYYASVLNNLAYLYRDLGQYDKALLLHQEALAIRKKVLGEDHPYYLRNLNGLGFLYNSLNRPNDAFPLLLKAAESELKYLRHTYTALSEKEKISFLTRESDQFYYLPSVLLGQKKHQSMLSKQIYKNELALKGMVLEDQKGVLNSIRRSGDSIALQLYKEWLANKAFLGKQMIQPLNKRVLYLDSLEEVTNVLEQQLSRTTAAFRQQLQNQNIGVEDIAQKLKKGEAAVEFICFKVYNNRNNFRTYTNRKWTDSVMYAALLLLPGDTTVYFLPLCEEKQLQRLLNASSGTTFQTVDQLYGRRKSDKRNIADSLYLLIWKPLEQYLQGVGTVYYAPAGLLHRLSFQALPISSTQLLIDKYHLHQLLSTRSITLPPQIISKRGTASLWGNINYSASDLYSQESLVYDKKSTRGQYKMDNPLSYFNSYAWEIEESLGDTSGWQPLPYTKSELDSLQNVLTTASMDVRTFSGSAATEENFKYFSGHSPGILHLATHGFFLPVRESKSKDAGTTSGSSAFTLQQNPLFRSGLVLAGGNHAWTGKSVSAGKEDGILTAYELTQMDLGSTDLVVLSACETALGDLKGNEGVIGLQRALKMAGVKQMIVSLWQVPDKATMQLMILFYRYWLKGQNTQEALRSAQLQLKSKYPHPYYWAAFVMVE